MEDEDFNYYFEEDKIVKNLKKELYLQDEYELYNEFEN